MKLSDVSRTDLTNTDVQTKLTLNLNPLLFLNTFSLTLTPGGALGYFLGGYVPPGPGLQIGTPLIVLKKISPKIDTQF